MSSLNARKSPVGKMTNATPTHAPGGSSGGSGSGTTSRGGQGERKSLYLNNGSAVQLTPDANRVKFPTRTTKTNTKLVLFPAEESSSQVLLPNEITSTSMAALEPTRTVSQNESVEAQIKSGHLKRVTAYCTADAYQLSLLKSYLDQKACEFLIHTHRYDEVLYTAFDANAFSGRSKHKPAAVAGDEAGSQAEPTEADWLLQDSFPLPSESSLVNLGQASALPRVGFDEKEERRRDERGLGAEENKSGDELASLFFFEYGVMVAWGLSEPQEKALLSEISAYSKEKLHEAHIETEALQFCHDPTSKGRVFGDIIVLREDHIFIKLSISHALAQSVKLSVFEERLEDAITSTQPIPELLAITGKVNLSNHQINQKIGQLFVLRIHINLVSNVLDTPEIFWAQRQWEGLYKAARAYLEISQRVEVLNQRTAVISDLLDMLKEHLTSLHGEFLEWIIIFLILIEVAMGIVEIYLLMNSSHV